METVGHTGSAAAATTIISRWAKALARPQPWPSGALTVPRLQAHRGYWLGGAQENTMAAFSEAQRMGARMIELDVRLSKDLIPVVYHDEDLGRFSSPSGGRTLLSNLTAKEISQSVGAPTLAEVLNSTQITAKINIELKTTRILNESLERRVLREIDRSNAWDRVLISSFNPFSLWRISLMTDRLPLALLVAEDMEYQILRELWLLPFLKFHLLHLSQAMASPEVLSYWRSKGVPVAVWTVNDAAQAAALLEGGCLSIISDNIFSELNA